MSFFENLEDPLPLIKVLADQSPIAVQIYDSEGYSIYVNDHFKKMFGSSPPPGYCVLKDPIIEQMGVLSLVQKTLVGKITTSPVFWYDPRELKGLSPSETEYVQKYGKKCAIQTQHVPVVSRTGGVSHMVFFHRDITGELFMQEERERANKERDDARALNKNVLDQTLAVIYIKDPDGKFIFVNNQFCRIFNLSSDQVLGKTGDELFSKELNKQFRLNDQEVLRTRSHLEVEETAVHADGSTHVYLSLKFPVEDSAAEIIGVCGISTDVTKIRKMELELNAAKQLEAMALLAGGVAHNFNNVLEIILMTADSLLMRKSSRKPDDWRKAIESIKTAARSASFLTRQLLAFGRMQSFQPCVLDLGTVMSGMDEILRTALREDIQVSVEVEPNVWPVKIDPIQIEQLLINLFLNARDAMPNGGRLMISVRNLSREWVELKIADDGIGIESHMLEKIFEPFFTTKASHGTGLGLATVRDIVASAKGTIAVESQPARGTTFRICLPRATEQLALSQKKDSSAKAMPDRRNETILLVEDQGALRHITASVLREYGHTVIEARDGQVALELWPQISKQVDLIIADVIMPKINGPDLIKKISALSSRPLKVLFVSAYSEMRLDEKILDRDAVYFIEKPYTAQGLFKKIAEILSAEPGAT